MNARAIALKTFGLFFIKKKFLPSLGKIQSILFIRIDRVGDMVLSTPAFKAIKAALPQVRLTVMASPANAAILKNNPDVDDVIVYDRFAGLHAKVSLIKKLRSQQFSLAIDPHNDYELKTACLAALSGAANRIGYAAFGREFFFDCPSPKIEGNKHFVDGALDLLKRIGILSENRNPVIYLGADEQAWAGQWLQENGFPGKKIVAIHPGAYYETQRWLPEYYAELIDLIRQETLFEVMVLASPAEKFLVETILDRVKQTIPVCIQHDLRKFLALLSQCHTLICNNSGPLHCATALNIPTLSFMGPTAKAQWMPIGAIHRVLRRDDLPCIGCNLGYCKIKTHDCMRLIRPERVIDLMFERTKL